MKHLLAILGCCMVVQSASAQQKSSGEAIAEQRLDISRGRDGEYSGPGWDRLVADAKAAQFVMIGEQHATADIAKFGVAFHRALAPYGYTHAALEVGPWSTDFAESLIRSGDGKLAAFIAQPGNSFTLPFLFFDEEIALAEQIVARSPDKSNALWGLDQEFIGAGPIVVELLGRHARSDAQRAALREFAAKASEDPMLIGKIGEEGLGSLGAAFSGNAEAKALIDDLRLSTAIYGPFVRRSGPIYPANLRRENYMKSNFVRNFEDAERRLGAPPKVFMKFGGYHAMRGFSGTNVPAFGNFLAEWGHARSFGLLNMMVDCSGGEAMNPQTNEAGPCEPYFGSDSPLAALGRERSVTLVDLRPLRPQLNALKNLDPKTRETILAFDYYMAIRDVKAATPVAALSGKPR